VREAKITQTVDYFTIPAPFPCSVALFSCRCGATAVEYDLEQTTPAGWSTAEDGSDRCPRCSAAAVDRAVDGPPVGRLT
jgi:hypothetical protein